MRRLKKLAALTLVLALVLPALSIGAAAKTNPVGQTVGAVLFYVRNRAGEDILVSQLPVSGMEADMAAGSIDTANHNYSLLDRFVTTIHQEAQGFTVPEFVAYAQAKSSSPALKSLPLTFAGEDKIAFWEIDQTGFDDMDTYTYGDLYGVARYNFPLLYQYWNYRTQDYYDPEGKLSRDEVIDRIFQGGEPETMLLSVRAFSQRYMITEGKYDAGDYNMENLWLSRGLLDNERTVRVMKPMTKDELYNKQPTAADTRYWVSRILLDMAASPSLSSLGAVAAPTATMTEDGENYYIRLSCTTPGASIYYNHNYISPSYMPTALYTGGSIAVPKSFFPSGKVTMTANVVKEGHTDAGVVTLTLTSSGAEAEWSSPYADVAKGAWYYDAVNYVSAGGLFDPAPDGGFAPEASMTRLMLAKALYRLSGSPAVSGKGPFVDTTDPAVVWAHEQGVVNGISAELFSPGELLTREQFAAMLWRYAKVMGRDTAGQGTLSQFPDSGNVASWAGEAMAWAVGEALINGTGAGTLSPQSTATRSQAAQILMKYGR